MQHIMKKVLNITFSFLFYFNSFGQDLMETALKNKPIIIESKAFEIKPDIMLLSKFDLVGQKIEEELLDDFKLQSEKEQKTFWKKSDFKNRIVIAENEKVNLDSIAFILKDLSIEERKTEIRGYGKYNNRELFLRSFPLGVSKPIYSSNGNFAIIGFSKGNIGLEIEIYQLLNEKWEFVCSSRRPY